MEFFTKEMLFNAAVQPLPGNTLISFANFQPDQLNLQKQWEFAKSELSYPSMYQNVT